ncbi:hypothetical protein [Streptomyces sp. CC53]|uniref:hypothetical protein n=1 Tax=Streptomyces sp. CC53 TaxID=1906740 RepID=UPI0015A6E297|nr:hypothetical protein [Streptomyces sp. CC53]
MAMPSVSASQSPVTASTRPMEPVKIVAAYHWLELSTSSHRATRQVWPPPASDT